MKIIVVDDERSSLHLFLDQIIDNGVDYHFFKDDVEGILDYANKNDIEGAFLDIYMPNMNGIELAKKLISIKPNIKIVFVTGYIVKSSDLRDIYDNVLGVINKPVTADELVRYIKKIKEETFVLKVNMYGGFDCFINDRLVTFSSSKSKELFALLLALNGKSLEMGLAISYLWPDKELDKAKILYRDAVWRLRQTLREIDFNCINFGRALLTLDKTNIICDYWENLKNHVETDEILLISYSWATFF